MIDAHIHLADARFSDDLEEVIRQAETAGITSFFCVSAKQEEWETVIALSEKHPNIRPFIGTHPWYAERHDASLLKKILLRVPSAGVGEIGSDAVKGSAGQEEVFRSQIDLAAELNRPCVIHNVKSFDRIAAVLKRMKKRPPALLFHGYSGTMEQALFLMRFNAFFSFSGAVFLPNRMKARQILAALSEDRILMETDAPDMMPPQELRCFATEKRNVPANLPMIIREAAKIRSTDFETLKSVLRRNAERFFTSTA